MCTKVYALMLMLFAVVSVYGQDNVIDEVVWVVGDEAILKSDVENERLNAQYEGRKFDGDPYCIIPEQLAIQKLFLHQAAIDSIEVSEQEIISDVERRTNWLIDQIGSKEKVEEYYNKTSTQIREMLRENIRDGKTVQKMQQQIVGDIKITPAEVRRYFKDLPQAAVVANSALWAGLSWYLNMRMWHSICKILTRYPRLWSLNSVSILSS